MPFTFEFACTQVWRKLERIPLGPNLTSVLALYLDCVDISEFQRSERMFAWPSNQLIRVRTFIPQESVTRTRRKLVSIGLFRLDKLRPGRDGIALYEILWRFTPPAKLFRPSPGLALSRPLARDRDDGLEPQKGHAIGDQPPGERGRFVRSGT
jgi:hypothetical protein